MEPRRPTIEQGDSVFREYAKHQPEYRTLPAYESPEGVVLTEWEFSEGERIAIARGAPLRLSIYKNPSAPLTPVLLEVGSPPPGPPRPPPPPPGRKVG